MNAFDRSPHAARGRRGQRELLRFLTCGSVDDGKSTLIGRLLFDSQLVSEDQLARRRARQPQARHHRGGYRTSRCLVDGLEAERQQGITIDVAHRFFATPRRSFIVADTPGHEQYTRNMATGASNASPRGPARRRPQGRAHPDQAPFHDLLAARHPRRRGRGEQDGPGGLRRGGVRAHRRRLRGLRRPPRLPLGGSGADQRALRRQRHHPLRQHALVPRPDAARAPGNGRRRRGRDREALPLPRAVGEPPEPRLPRLLRHRRLRPRRGRREGGGRCVGQGDAHRADRDRRRRPARGNGGRRRHLDAGGRDRPVAAATCWSGRRSGRRWPTSSPPTCSGWTRRRCCPAAPTPCASATSGPRPPSPPSATGST